MSSSDSAYFSNLPPRRGSSADDVIKLIKNQSSNQEQQSLQSGSLLKNLLKEPVGQRGNDVIHVDLDFVIRR